jgi:hypothetical protein
MAPAPSGSAPPSAAQLISNALQRIRKNAGGRKYSRLMDAAKALQDRLEEVRTESVDGRGRAEAKNGHRGCSGKGRERCFSHWQKARQHLCLCIASLQAREACINGLVACAPPHPRTSCHPPLLPMCRCWPQAMWALCPQGHLQRKQGRQNQRSAHRTLACPLLRNPPPHCQSSRLLLQRRRK